MSKDVTSAEKVLAGKHFPLGVSVDHQGANFAVYSPHADKVELCFFDEHDQQTSSHCLVSRTGDIWHGYLEGALPGQRYGYRVHGPFDPSQGFWFNPNKVIIDPYAQEITRPIEPNPHLFAHDINSTENPIRDLRDSALFIPKAKIPNCSFFKWTSEKPNTAWHDVIIYELHVKGFSQTNLDIPSNIRGTYLGVAHRKSIEHLKSLGITSVQLMPCVAFMSEHRLSEQGLTNYWGYNPALCFAPEPRYALVDAVTEFKTMVNALHEAGIEVVMDVVYNHTAESGMFGPVISNKGLHAREFYRYEENNYHHYIDNSGCGNSVDTHHPFGLQLVMDSLRHWVTEYQIDGFRFDLAASLGREEQDYSPNAMFFNVIHQDPVLANVKLISEPWDVGRQGYQLGQFPENWYECNDKYRDLVRAFWKGDLGMAADFATRIMGSNDIFHKKQGRSVKSINYVTYHDGFTLQDLVSYNDRHNQNNKENNLDGHNNNLSRNYGVEGETDKSSILNVRAKQKRNLIATLMLSQGAVHFLGGDEIGRTQHGNNNAYCQDNSTSWFNWTKRDTQLQAFVHQMVTLRNSSSLFRNLALYTNQDNCNQNLNTSVDWYRSDGNELGAADWGDPSLQCFAMLISANIAMQAQCLQSSVECYMVLFNASMGDVEFRLPTSTLDGWKGLCDTARNDGLTPDKPIIAKRDYLLLSQSVAVLGVYSTTE